MRIGNNPNKDLLISENDFLHQIVIPVYIPNLQGYFQSSLKVFQLCIDSLLNTINQQTFITIINNGSCAEVSDFLSQLYQENKIHELIVTYNLGKLNAIIKGITGHNFPLVTIADADVLFCSGWQNETYKILNNYPKVGVVGLTPQFKLFEYLSGNLIFDQFFSNNLKFTKVKNPEAMKMFYESIGWDTNYNKDYLNYHLCLEENKFPVVVGSGHFVATYKREIFKELISFNSFKLGGNSEEYIDRLSLEKGYWRVTTFDNFAFHIGNQIENWMLEVGYDHSNNSAKFVKQNNLEVSSFSKFKNSLIRKLLKTNWFKNYFYKKTSLPKEVIRSY